MKKIILFTSLLIMTQSHHSLCMETTNTTKQYTPQFGMSIFGYLNWHNSCLKHNFNACDEVEKLVNAGIDVNQKAPGMSRFCDMTPLDVAMAEVGCERCIALLRKKGAQTTDRSFSAQEYYFNK